MRLRSTSSAPSCDLADDAHQVRAELMRQDVVMLAAAMLDELERTGGVLMVVRKDYVTKDERHDMGTIRALFDTISRIRFV